VFIHCKINTNYRACLSQERKLLTVGAASSGSISDICFVSDIGSVIFFGTIFVQISDERSSLDSLDIWKKDFATVTHILYLLRDGFYEDSVLYCHAISGGAVYFWRNNIYPLVWTRGIVGRNIVTSFWEAEMREASSSFVVKPCNINLC